MDFRLFQGATMTEAREKMEHECGDVTVRKKRSGGEARRTPHARA